MGLKLMKFHGILHMADAILDFGVPLEHDAGVNERHHIPTKKASLLTQRDMNNIEEQTAERMLEMEVLALAKLEIGGMWLCDYCTVLVTLTTFQMPCCPTKCAVHKVERCITRRRMAKLANFQCVLVRLQI